MKPSTENQEHVLKIPPSLAEDTNFNLTPLSSHVSDMSTLLSDIMQSDAWDEAVLLIYSKK